MMEVLISTLMLMQYEDLVVLGNFDGGIEGSNAVDCEIQICECKRAW